MLRKCLKHESIAAHPTRLTVGDCSHYQDATNFGRDGRHLEHDGYISNSKNRLIEWNRRIVKLLHSYFVPNDTIFRRWDFFVDRVLAGHSAYVLAILLLLLSNLEVLSYDYHVLMASPWLEIELKMAGLNITRPHAPLPLHHLQTVELLYYNDGSVRSSYSRTESLIWFIGLPSLQSLYAQRLTSRASNWRNPPPASVIVRLTFDDSCINTEALSRIRNLREFTYRCSHRSWRPRLVVESLLRYEYHSLVLLCLITSKDLSYWYPDGRCSDIYIDSLREFRLLTSILLDLPMLIDNSRTMLRVNDENHTLGGEHDESDDGHDSLHDSLPSQTWYLDVSEDLRGVHRLVLVRIQIQQRSTQHERRIADVRTHIQYDPGPLRREQVVDDLAFRWPERH